MTKNRATTAKGRSYEEIGEYWDKHDVGEVLDRTEPVELEVDIRSEKRYYHLDRELSERVNAIAQSRGVSPEALINSWIREKVQGDH